MARIKIPVAELEFDTEGNTIWIHSPNGGTVLRIKTKGKIIINNECENINSHSDIIVNENINFCLTDDAEEN